MRIQSKNFFSRLYGLVRNRVNCIEIIGDRIIFPNSSQNEVDVLEINADSKLKAGLFSSSIQIPLKSGEWIKSNGFSKKQAELFNEHLQSCWRTTILHRFELMKPSFEKLKDVIERLENPKSYPGALNVLPFLNEAIDFISMLPSTLPTNLFDPSDINWIKRINYFVNNAVELREQAIKKFVTTELERTKEFFDQFESNPLTQEQRNAILTDEDSTQVLASAGSGKTSVITAKVAYLLKSKISSVEQILVLAFARNSALEMKERIRQKIGQELNVTTFHALGYEIIQAVEGKKPALVSYAADELGFRNHLKDIIQTHLFNQKPIQNLLIKWFSEYLIPYRSEWEFKSLDDYYTFVEDKNYRTLSGQLVKGYEELVIANWLFTNGIEYEYEATYQHEIPNYDRRVYQPDFFLPKFGIYIEHWGVRWAKDDRGNKILFTSPVRNREEYLKGMEWKRAIHKKYDTKLIETFSYEFKDQELTKLLELKLAKHEVFPQPVSLDAIFKNLNSFGMVDKLTDILATFLRHFKNSDSSIEDCISKVKTRKLGNRNLIFLKIFEPLFTEYQKRLGERIDFEDMINRATEHVKSGRYKSPFRHILVDEFQDISDNRANLLLALKKQRFDTKIFVVGDDWQSIYRFSGSDLNLVWNFGEIFGGKFADRIAFMNIYLTKTFRCTDKISNVASRFILKNPLQMKKDIHSIVKSLQQAILIKYYQKDNLDLLLHQVLSRIDKNFENNSPTSVLILGRYHKIAPKNIKFLRTEFPSLNIDFKTVHASKGLEADHVIILEVNKQSFPSEIVDDPILGIILPVPEKYEHAEERRLFYVALTRAKLSVTILADKSAPSCFVKELISEPEYQIEGPHENEKVTVDCPTCNGPLHKISARDGKVYFKCRHQELCDTFLPSCPRCKSNLPIKQEFSNNFICSCGTEFPACSECTTGWLVIRSGKFGDFQGCINYPHCKGKLKLSKTKSLIQNTKRRKSNKQRMSKKSS